MKRILLIFSLVMLFASFLGAQDLIDVVYLKNGTVIKGSIIKPLDEDGLKIMTSSSDVFTYSAKEVRRVTREKMEHVNIKNTINAHKSNGFTNITTLAYGFGIGALDVNNTTVDNGLDYFSIQTINGYHINEKLSLGLGVGVEFHGADGNVGDSYTLLPVFADLRFMPVRKVMAPFFYANAGYGLGVFEPDANGGAMFGLGGGVQWSLSRATALVASFGYRFQGHSFAVNGGSDTEFNANYLNFKVGFKF